METIFDHNVTREEFDKIFDKKSTAGANITYENYLSIGYNQSSCLYHISLLYSIRGNERKAKKYRKRSGIPTYSFTDYCY